MTKPAKIPALDELANAVMAADPTDQASLQAVAVLLLELREIPAASKFGELFDQALQRVDAVTKLEGEDAQREFDALCNLVAEVQHALENAKPEAEEAAPAWIDQALIREFADGARTSLDDAEAEILAAEKGSADAVGMLHRRIHTLKGESGVLGMSGITQVCHAAEDALALPPGAVWADRLLKGCDWLRNAIALVASGKPEPSPAPMLDLLKEPIVESQEEQTAEAVLSPALAEAAPAEPPKVFPQNEPVAGQASVPTNGGAVVRDEETLVLFGEFLHESEDGLTRADQVLMNIEREGVDEETVNQLFRIFHTIKGVAGVLEVQHVTSLAHATESMLNRVREGKLELRGPVVDLVFDSTEMMGGMLRGVHAAVEAGTDFPPTEGLDKLLERLEAMLQNRPVLEVQPEPQPGLRLGEILSMPPLSIPAAAIEQALSAQKATGRRLGEELVAQGAARPKQIVQALRAQAASTDAAGNGQAGNKLQETIKVDLGRVDSLVEMIGELVIVETMVAHAPEVVGLSSRRLQNYLGQLSKITRDLQDVGMRMRMVPVRGVFQKMARMARDLGKKADKQVRLVTSGEGTEMDRSMVEQVADPLVHMIRNAVDHGLEPPAEREQAGKSPLGTVHLSAYHEGGSIIIEIEDDGRGMDRDAILRKARSKGLVGENDKLTDAEIYNLVFAPGFSTAAKVTEISGRGVGMDVVKRNVEKMRGRVLISTRLGEGTTFKIVLPLTLAIIDGMLVRCGEERYIVPTLSILESIQPEASMVVTFAGRGELVNVRGEIIPLLRLDRLFSIAGAQPDPTRGLVVVIESLGRKLGLLVDEVITQQQVVIKSLGTGLSSIRFVSGAAILSDGRVGLILNMEEIGTLVGFDAIARARDRSGSGAALTQGGAE